MRLQSNGKVRVHNLFGVPAGHCITLDSTQLLNDKTSGLIASAFKFYVFFISNLKINLRLSKVRETMLMFHMLIF
jgi:hypothetical protein